MPTVYGYVHKHDNSPVAAKQHMAFSPLPGKITVDTATDGSYSLTLDPGVYQVTINGCSAIPAQITVVPAPPSLQRFDFKRTCKPDGSPEIMAIVHGVVAASPNGSVIHHVVVTRRDSGHVFDFWTTESGRFLTELPIGEYDVTVNGVPPRVGSASIRLRVAPVELKLTPSADPVYAAEKAKAAPAKRGKR